MAVRGAGSAPAFGPEALAPDWENREVSTGVRRGPEFGRPALGPAGESEKPEWPWA